MRILVIAIMALIGTTPSFAALGNSSGGGGQGIVCRNDDGAVTSAELLDLAEAENYLLLELQQQPTEKSYLEIAHDYAAILNEAIPSTMPTSKMTTTHSDSREEISYDINIGILFSKKNNPFVSSLVDWIDSGKKLIPGNNFSIPPVGDSHPRIVPVAKNCRVEQIAFYKDGNNQVYIVGSIWNKLDNTNKAALLIHEALYRNLRELGDSTSDRTRKTIGYLFSGMKFEWVLNGLPQEYLFCWSQDREASFQFVVYPNENNHATALFLVYDGEIMLTKTTTDLNLAPFARAFGMPISQKYNITNMNTIQNPLLDLPNYSFRTAFNDSNGEVTASIEAFALTAGNNKKQISCQKGPSLITYGDNGSVSIKQSGF